MKKILLLTLADFENIDKRGLYPDLVRTLINNDCEVSVVSPIERRKNLKTELITRPNLKVLRVNIGNITKCNFIEKGISTILFEYQYLRAIKKYFGDTHFDLVLYSTPPISFSKIIKYFKTTYKTKTYLMLKDIFPQNAVDIGLLKKDGIIHKYFRRKEEQLYRISDHIGCMSQGNVSYILKHNPWLDKNKVEVFPNAIIPIERRENKTKDFTILDKYKIPHDSVIFIYGGNLGKPQGIDFLIQVIDSFHEVKNGFLLIVGSGTEYNRIDEHISSKKQKNVALYQHLPKDEYDKLLSQADIGLIFLDKRFTIPNFPSRLTAYMENSMPIIAATDKNTDIKDVIVNSGSGLWSESGDIGSFIKNADMLSKDTELRTKMSLNSRKYLEENYDVRNTISIVVKKMAR